MTTWRKSISSALEISGECWGDVVSNTLTEEDLDIEFDDDFGWIHGKPFTLWTSKRVYFPAQYDGAESVESVSRNPDGKPTEHI